MSVSDLVGFTTQGGFVFGLKSLAHFTSNDDLYFLLDDDLGRSDSSSGSMDSFQVGPTVHWLHPAWGCSFKCPFSRSKEELLFSHGHVV